MVYIRSNSIKSQASGAGNVSNADVTGQESVRSRVRVDQRVSAVKAVEVPVLVCLRSGCNHVIEAGGT